MVLLINYFILQEKILLYDPLTSARNRFALNIEIARLTSKKQKFGIIFIDLDHFKSINDTFNHLGYVCRFGGDAFIVIINESHLNSAKDLLLTLGLNFKKHNIESNKSYDINYSYGFDL